MKTFSRNAFLKTSFALAAFATMGASWANPIAPTSWELAGEFSLTTSAGGTWSYGWKNDPNNPFSYFSSQHSFAANLIGWVQWPSQLLPAVFQNQMTTPIVVSGNSYPARGVVMHPGTAMQVATVRFNPPAAGYYRVSGQFYAQDGNGSGTHTQVQVARVDPYWGTPLFLFNGSIAYPNMNQQSFTSKLVMLSATDKLDFDVAAGPGNNYFYGSTGLHVVIERIGDYCPPTPTGSASPC